MICVYLFILINILIPISCSDIRLIKTINNDVVSVLFNITSKDQDTAWAYQYWDQCTLQADHNCGQMREIACINFGKPEHYATLVSPEYCKNIQKPTSYGNCKICSQDCVMTTWTRWSQCSKTCNAAVRYRTRNLVQEPVNDGKGCGSLSEIEDCKGLPECVDDHIITIYEWKINEWTSCRETKPIPLDAGCSEQIGERLRQVECVDSHGQSVSVDNCLYRLSDNSMPAEREFCHLPCDCKVSAWKPFSNCTKPCYTVGSSDTGVIRRTREITEFPRFGGDTCPHLVEEEPCDVSTLELCPEYTWHAFVWNECRLTDKSKSCGPGVSRRQVYCTRADDEERREVNEHHCTGIKPSNRLACQLNCPNDCQLGEWENWSPCTKSCGAGGVHIRTRKVLVEPQYEGSECDATMDYKECLLVNCSWWYSGTWSACFAASGVYGDCGAGTQSRSVYCKSALNDVLPNDNCTGMEKPERKQTCTIPCPGDCAVSEWSEWSTCSETCGPVGGIQMRTRLILGLSNSTAEPCISEDELHQTRVCGHWDNCRSHHWQVYPWETCVSDDFGTCGHMNGTQIRKVLCEMDSEPSIDESMCDPSLKPNVSRPCDVICPIDCRLSLWSEWTQCSASCGNGTRYRTQRIFTLNHYGGEACPDEADEDGVITIADDCADVDPCYSYSWQPNDWNECEHIGNSCGTGLQTRTVDCLRSDGKVMEIGVCLRELLEIPPDESQQCFMPCEGDCGLTEWGNFGPCQKQYICSQYVEGDYCRIRSRAFFHQEGITYDNSNDQFNLCPHISFRDFQDGEECEGPNYTYMWQEGIWRSCIPFTDKGNALCGDGRKWRTVLCLRSDGFHVPEHYCDEVSAVPASSKTCTVKCSQDCEVSDWNEWTVCSHNCGQGTKTRYRTVTQEMNRGGRLCPPLDETIVCELRSCDEFIWDVSEWNSCKAVSSDCGTGTQSRSVRCRAGEEYESECELRETRPQSNVACNLPCAGDCVLSEWSSFTPCPAVCSQDAVKTRTRTLVRQPSSNGQPCQSLEEIVPCSVEDCATKSLSVELGEWQACKAISGDCGKGKRQRTIHCIDNNGINYDLKRCGDIEAPSMEDCEVICTQDCVLGRYGDYSECSDECGMEGHMYRERDILEANTGLGRRCPKNSHSLVQTKPCNVVPCYEYKFQRGEWSSCSINLEMGCGSGLRTRSVECRRSDDALGAERDCLIALILNRDPSTVTDIEFELSSANKTQLDIHTSETCGRPCPGDCQVTNWSSFTPCINDCYGDESTSPVKVRTRAIIKTATTGGLKCPDAMQEERSCLVSEAICPLYMWHTSPWNLDTKQRAVWCQDQDGRKVTGGCIHKLKPISEMQCSNDCEDQFMQCVDGLCQCQDGFQMFFNVCIPLEGCQLDSHCPLYSHCSEDICHCNVGYIQDFYGLCKVDGAYDSSGVAYEDESNIWIWIVIGVCLLMIIVFVIFCILIFRNHRRNALMKKKTKEAEIAEREKMNVTAV
ncbi:thrombospondin type-1 domain-containing protein 7A-like isoform X2 [Antedon mediterranea]|uniref:thrombospondin type-1 domain-containing protein 7A-like isoform X2 n=1 Tax=Antedon mediterranea TaxID=105859 RepID=UPI003AF4B08F